MTNKFALGLEITADPAKAKAGLAETRLALLKTYSDTKEQVAKLSETLDQAKAKAADMGKALSASGPPTKAMVADFEKARAAVRAASEAVEKKTLALQKTRQAAREVGDALESVARTEKAAAAANAWKAQLVAAQALIDAENALQQEIRATAAARDTAQAKALAATRAEAAQLTRGRDTAISTSLGTLNTRSGADVRSEIADANRAVRTLKENGAAASDIARAAQAAQARIAALSAELNGTVPAGNAASNSMAGVAHRMAAMAAAAIAVREAIQLMRESVAAGVQFDSLKTQYVFGNGGDVRKGADEMAYAAELSNRLGMELLKTTQDYGKLQSASRGTSLEGQKTRDIFTAVASASAVMGLSAEQQSGTLLAVSQMMSKGVVSAEELRGQLGERLPGAFQIAAKAMGVTTAGLQKMLEAGELTAENFLPKFAAALQASVDGALPAAEKSARAQLQRLENAFTEFKLRISSSGLLDKVAEQVERLLEHIGNLADSGELDRLATSFAGAFGSAAKFMADATIFAERFAGVLIPLGEALAAVMVGGRLLALAAPATAAGIAATGAAAGTASVGVGLLAGALRLIPGLALGAAVLYGLEKLVEWGAKASEARAISDALDASVRKLIDTNSEHASAAMRDADMIQEFGDEAFAAYEKAILGAQKYAAAKVVDLTQHNKNGQFDSDIAFYREQSTAYSEYLETIVAGEKLRREKVQLTGQILAKEAEREKLLAGEVKQTKKEALDEQIKGYDKLVESIRKAREESQKEAEEAKKKAVDLREKAADKQQSASDKATQIRNKDLSPEDKQALDLQAARDAQSQGSYAAARAGVAQLEGRGKDFERYAKEADKFLDRAMKFAESAQDANLIEDIGKQQAALDNSRAKAEDKKAADAEAQSAALMDQLNAAQAKLKELKGEAATIQVNADISNLVSKLAEAETKLAALDGKKATTYVETVYKSSGSQAAVPADTASVPSSLFPAFAGGGPLPGSAPHDRADNMLYWGTPGEHVMQIPAVRYYGRAFMDAVNHMRLPKFAFGGQLGGSAIDRLNIPSLPSGMGTASGHIGGSNLTLDFGELGKFQASTSQSTQRELERVFVRAAMARGRK